MTEASIISRIRYLTSELISPLMRTSRHNLVPGSQRHESVAEHSFHVAYIALHLYDQFPDLDLQKVMTIALEHDFAESLTGDISVYASKSALGSKDQQEKIAIETLGLDAAQVGIRFRGLDDYVAHLSAEAKFVSAVDKIVPYFLVLSGTGHHAHPTLEEYDRTCKRAVKKVSESFPLLLPVLLSISQELRERVIELNINR